MANQIPILQQELDQLRRQSEATRRKTSDDGEKPYESAADVAARKSTRHASESSRLSVLGEECEEANDAVYADTGLPRVSLTEPPPLWTGAE